MVSNFVRSVYMLTDYGTRKAAKRKQQPQRVNWQTQQMSESF